MLARKKLLIAMAVVPLAIAALINLYFVHVGWHGKIPGYLIFWATPCSAVLDSGIAISVESVVRRHLAGHS
jgi:hypothetical protein